MVVFISTINNQVNNCVLNSLLLGSKCLTRHSGLNFRSVTSLSINKVFVNDSS